MYEGMVVGEHSREADLEVNPCKEKKLTNVRCAGRAGWRGQATGSVGGDAPDAAVQEGARAVAARVGRKGRRGPVMMGRKGRRRLSL